MTGRPGVGKTTVLLKTVETLKNKGYCVGGMISREVRVGRTRKGFRILDLNSCKNGWLAHTDQEIGPKVGRYHVNLEDLSKIGVEAIEGAIKNADLIVIDEVGPMELYSEKFRQTVKKVIDSGKIVIGVVHWKGKERLIEKIKRRKDVEVEKITFENSKKIHEILVMKALEFLESQKDCTK